tara:strand:+ start:2452 stop:3072 length:621 start_codon:yes stop_codon:yes gene_type:complete
MQGIQYEADPNLPSDEALIARRLQTHNADFPRDLTIDQALDYLEMECAMMGQAKFVLGSYYERLHQKKNRRQLKEHSAICLHITLDDKDIDLVSQQWVQIEQNIYALYLTLRNINALSKWGVVESGQVMRMLSDRSIREIKVNSKQFHPKDSMVKPDWMDVLGVEFGDTLDHANKLYRQKAKESASDESALLELNQAIQKARNYFA